jgi:hypothetical protein
VSPVRSRWSAPSTTLGPVAQLSRQVDSHTRSARRTAGGAAATRSRSTRHTSRLPRSLHEGPWHTKMSVRAPTVESSGRCG